MALSATVCISFFETYSIFLHCLKYVRINKKAEGEMRLICCESFVCTVLLDELSCRWIHVGLFLSSVSHLLLIGLIVAFKPFSVMQLNPIKSAWNISAQKSKRRVWIILDRRVARTHKAPIVATYIPSKESHLTLGSPLMSLFPPQGLALVKDAALLQLTNALVKCPKLHLKAWKRSVCWRPQVHAVYPLPAF